MFSLEGWRILEALNSIKEGSKKYCPVIKSHRIHIFLSLLDLDPDPLVRGMDPDPDPSITKQK
jgi:hypothetical protein